jgi:hypothetical protein
MTEADFVNETGKTLAELQCRRKIYKFLELGEDLGVFWSYVKEGLLKFEVMAREFYEDLR